MRAHLVFAGIPLLAAPAAAQLPPIGRIEIPAHAPSAPQVRSILADLEDKPVSGIRMRVRGRRTLAANRDIKGGIFAALSEGKKESIIDAALRGLARTDP